MIGSFVPSRILVVSPHCDDAVFSCGGFLSLAALQCIPILVINVFDGGLTNSAHLSPIARSLLRDSGLPARLASAARRDEDRRALRILRAASVYLGLRDAVFRTTPYGQSLYPSDSSLRRPNPRDTRIFATILEKRLRCHPWVHDPHGLVLGPSGLGGHVDHIACVEALQQLRTRPYMRSRILFYADFPYCIVRPHPEAHRAHFTTLTPEAVETRIVAGLAYRSQIAMIWKTRHAYRRAAEEYLFKTGADDPGEFYYDESAI